MDVPEDQIKGQDTPRNLENLQTMIQTYKILQQKHSEVVEDKIVAMQQQLEDAQKKNIEFALVIEELSIERDCVKTQIFEFEGKVREREEELLRRIDDAVREKEYLEEEIYEGARGREELVRKIEVVLREKQGLLKDIDGLQGRNEDFDMNITRGLRVLGLMKECLMRVNESSDGKELGYLVGHGGGNMEGNLSIFEEKLSKCKNMEGFMEELASVSKMAKRAKENLDDYGKKKVLLRDTEAYKRRIKELEDSLLKDLEVLVFVEESLTRVNESLNDKAGGILVEHESRDIEEDLKFEEKSEGLVSAKVEFVSRMAKRVEHKMNAFIEKLMNEKKEYERSVMSLTEENRDVNALLRIALVEKEAAEKSLSKFKGNNEQWRVPLMQFAERGLQRVGFGFIVGGASNEQYEYPKKNSDDQTSDSILSDVSSECEEEVVSLASTVEKIMKSLRLEITRLKRDMEDSRSETERLQNLTEKQAQQISEQTFNIKELEDRERILTQNIDELLIEIKATEEEAERWREACKLEVEAGKHVAQEHNTVVAILKQEIEKTRTALQMLNRKLKLKEEVAAAAMAAQSAAERSLQLADCRAAGFRERIEELTRQVEEVERIQKNNKRRMRRICWPWQALNPSNATSTRVKNLDIQSMLPVMQAFQH